MVLDNRIQIAEDPLLENQIQIAEDPYEASMGQLANWEGQPDRAPSAQRSKPRSIPLGNVRHRTEEDGCATSIDIGQTTEGAMRILMVPMTRVMRLCLTATGLLRELKPLFEAGA